MLPIVLLDLDGVINAVSDKFPSIHPQDTWNVHHRPFEGFGWPIMWSTVVRDFLLELDTVAEIRWHTTWQHDAHGISEALGLPKWEIADPEGLHFSQNVWWKRQAAINVTNVEKRPLIWIDDDLSEYEVRLFYAGCHKAGDFLLVKPTTEVGLSTKQMREIRDFCEKYQKQDTTNLDSDLRI